MNIKQTKNRFIKQTRKHCGIIHENISGLPEWFYKTTGNNIADVFFSIPYRDGKLVQNSHAFTMYIPSSDGWFRKESEPAKGYGLAIRKLKPTGRSFDTENGFHVTRYSMTYLPSSADIDDPDLYERMVIELWVHHNIDTEDVLDYVEKKKFEWVP
jgi:hypothetical protein